MYRMDARSINGLIIHVSKASATAGLNRLITSPAVYAKKVEANQISKLYIGMTLWSL